MEHLCDDLRMDFEFHMESEALLSYTTVTEQII
jgi:hypothetical protein